jgi:hypothetical protein
MYRRIFFVTCSTRSAPNPGHPAYYESEIGLPIFFAIRTERVQDEAKGTVKSTVVFISWQTTAENNTRHYELQRSENGRDFYPIETFMAAGISKTISRYATTDLIYDACSDHLYYRLKLLFTNGKELFSDVITLDLNKVKAASVYDLTYNRNNQ